MPDISYRASILSVVIPDMFPREYIFTVVIPDIFYRESILYYFPNTSATVAPFGMQQAGA